MTFMQIVVFVILENCFIGVLCKRCIAYLNTWIQFQIIRGIHRACLREPNGIAQKFGKEMLK